MDLNTVVWGMQAVWWLVLGIVLTALLILVLVSLPVLGRVGGLRRTGERLRRHQVAMEAVAQRAAELQRRTDELAVQAAGVQDRIGRLGSARKPAEPSRQDG